MSNHDWKNELTHWHTMRDSTVRRALLLMTIHDK